MFFQIFCTMLHGWGLNEAARDVLLRAACELYREGKSAKRIKTDGVSGRVATQGKFAVLGAVSGQVFCADIETEKGLSRVEYIVRTASLEKRRLDEIFRDGFWLGRDDTREKEARWN